MNKSLIFFMSRLFGLPIKEKNKKSWEEFEEFEAFAKNELTDIEKLKFDLENELKEVKDIKQRLGYLKAQVEFYETLRERFEIQITNLHEENHKTPLNVKKVESLLRIISEFRNQILIRGRIIYETLETLMLSETHVLFSIEQNQKEMKSYHEQAKSLIAKLSTWLSSINGHNEFLDSISKRLNREKARL